MSIVWSSHQYLAPKCWSQEHGGPPLDQQRLARPGGQLLRCAGKVLAQLADDASLTLTLVVVPCIEEDGRQLIARHGWHPVGVREDWLVAHRGAVHNSSVRELGEGDFRALLRHIPRAHKVTGPWVQHVGVSAYSPQAVVSWDEIIPLWDDHAAEVQVCPDTRGLDVWQQFLAEHRWVDANLVGW